MSSDLHQRICYELGMYQLEVKEEEKDLSVLVDHKMTVSCQCDAATKKANAVL